MKVKPPHKAPKKSQDFWKYFGFFEPNRVQRVELFSREYLNSSNITWKRSLILKTHCVLKIFSKQSCVKNSPATGVRGERRRRFCNMYVLAPRRAHALYDTHTQWYSLSLSISLSLSTYINIDTHIRITLIFSRTPLQTEHAFSMNRCTSNSEIGWSQPFLAKFIYSFIFWACASICVVRACVAVTFCPVLWIKNMQTDTPTHSHTGTTDKYGRRKFLHRTNEQKIAILYRKKNSVHRSIIVVCVCVCVFKRESVRESMCLYLRLCVSLCVCLFACVDLRASARVCVCVCVIVCDCVFLSRFLACGFA